MIERGVVVKGFRFPCFDGTGQGTRARTECSEMATTLASTARDEIGRRNAVCQMLLLSAKKDVAE
jgi:hypothetical protein